jgi:hypothetical protein
MEKRSCFYFQPEEAFVQQTSKSVTVLVVKFTVPLLNFLR